MKFTKSSLLSSLAAAGMVLGAVAPVVANAADTKPFVPSSDSQNTLTVDAAGDYKVTTASGQPQPGYLASKVDGDGNTVINYGNGYVANSAAANSNDGSAQGISEALVKITAGYLTLDAVPDFNFGTVTAGAKAATQNFSGVINDDGNNTGILQITDGRSTNGSNGYKLTAIDSAAVAGFQAKVSKALAAANVTDTGDAIAKSAAGAITTDGKQDLPTAKAAVENAVKTAIAALPDDASKTAANNVISGTADTPSIVQTALFSGSNDGMGYNLQVGLGNFQKLSNNNVRTGDPISGFKLFLPDFKGTTDNVSAPDGNSFAFNGAGDGIAEIGDNGTAVTVASAPAGQSYGTAKVNFNNVNGKTKTLLQVPGDIAQGSYDAPIYWVLNADATANVNPK